MGFSILLGLGFLWVATIKDLHWLLFALLVEIVLTFMALRLEFGLQICRFIVGSRIAYSHL